MEVTKRSVTPREPIPFETVDGMLDTILPWIPMVTEHGMVIEFARTESLPDGTLLVHLPCEACADPDTCCMTHGTHVARGRAHVGCILR